MDIIILQSILQPISRMASFHQVTNPLEFLILFEFQTLYIFLIGGNLCSFRVTSI